MRRGPDLLRGGHRRALHAVPPVQRRVRAGLEPDRRVHAHHGRAVCAVPSRAAVSRLRRIDVPRQLLLRGRQRDGALLRYRQGPSVLPDGHERARARVPGGRVLRRRQRVVPPVPRRLRVPRRRVRRGHGQRVPRGGLCGGGGQQRMHPVPRGQLERRQRLQPLPPVHGGHLPDRRGADRVRRVRRGLVHADAGRGVRLHSLSAGREPRGRREPRGPLRPVPPGRVRARPGRIGLHALPCDHHDARGGRDGRRELRRLHGEPLLVRRGLHRVPRVRPLAAPRSQCRLLSRRRHEPPARAAGARRDVRRGDRGPDVGQRARAVLGLRRGRDLRACRLRPAIGHAVRTVLRADRAELRRRAVHPDVGHAPRRLRAGGPRARRGLQPLPAWHHHRRLRRLRRRRRRRRVRRVSRGHLQGGGGRGRVRGVPRRHAEPRGRELVRGQLQQRRRRRRRPWIIPGLRARRADVPRGADAAAVADARADAGDDAAGGHRGARGAPREWHRRGGPPLRGDRERRHLAAVAGGQQQRVARRGRRRDRRRRPGRGRGAASGAPDVVRGDRTHDAPPGVRGVRGAAPARVRPGVGRAARLDAARHPGARAGAPHGPDARRRRALHRGRGRALRVGPGRGGRAALARHGRAVAPGALGASQRRGVGRPRGVAAREPLRPGARRRPAARPRRVGVGARARRARGVGL